MGFTDDFTRSRLSRVCLTLFSVASDLRSKDMICTFNDQVNVWYCVFVTMFAQGLVNVQSGMRFLRKPKSCPSIRKPKLHLHLPRLVQKVQKI